MRQERRVLSSGKAKSLVALFCGRRKVDQNRRHFWQCCESKLEEMAEGVVSKEQEAAAVGPKPETAGTALIQ